MSIKNQEVLSSRKTNEADKDNILVKLDYEKFLQDITLNVIDVKDWLEDSVMKMNVMHSL